ncbi:unnamed protein product [Darwinula stevensoni]|uniref:Protein Wnt n=1 Tax=Darwinula stevensoni TaxID=69355 RepID=A0A7R9A2Z2_9CRUS|nr:unnamed protein product [Darwinula stevensoni]CAG0890731.1 unnamed protein product [Darwinula stevensoni]
MRSRDTDFRTTGGYFLTVAGDKVSDAFKSHRIATAVSTRISPVRPGRRLARIAIRDAVCRNGDLEAASLVGGVGDELATSRRSTVPIVPSAVLPALSRVASTGPSLGLRDPSICGKLGEALVKRQKNFCLHYPNFMESVIFGAIAAIDECQFQFRSRRWNCSTLEDSALMAGVDPEDILERDADSSSASTSVHVLNGKRRSRESVFEGILPIGFFPSPSVAKKAIRRVSRLYHRREYRVERGDSDDERRNDPTIPTTSRVIRIRDSERE